MSFSFNSKQITLRVIFLLLKAFGDFYFHPFSLSRNPATLRIGKIGKKRITCENVQDCVSRTPLQDQESELQQDRYVSPFLYDFTPIYSQKILEHPPSPPFCRLLLVYHDAKRYTPSPLFERHSWHISSKNQKALAHYQTSFESKRNVYFCRCVSPFERLLFRKIQTFVFFFFASFLHKEGVEFSNFNFLGLYLFSSD